MKNAGVHLLAWCVLGSVIGIGVAMVFWWVMVAVGGKSLPEALRGEVEDAIGTLKAMVVLGFLIGGGVGVAHGLGQTKGRQPRGRQAKGDGQAKGQAKGDATH